VEVLSISVGFSNPTVYCLAYVPPNAKDKYWLQFLDYIESLNNISSNIVLLGDFNCGDINWSLLSSNNQFSQLCNVLFELNLFQLINEPSHSAGNIPLCWCLWIFHSGITVRDNNHPPWFNSDIRHHIKCTRALRRKHKCHPTEYSLANLERSQQLLQEVYEVSVYSITNFY